MKFHKDQLLLYGITDQTKDEALLCRQVEQALTGGATIIQLRLKNTPQKEVVRMAQKLCPICHSHNAPLIINDDPEAAFLSGADGVHVGVEDMEVCAIREKYGADFIIGATAKTVEQALKAKEEGADYLGVGAVFPSPTKQNAIRITTRDLNEISRAGGLPVVAIGGINEENANALAGAKINGIAVVSALFSAPDITRAAGRLRETATKLLCDS